MYVFENITTSITGQIDKLWEHSAELITSIAPIFSLAFGVYVLLQVWHYYNKGLDESLMDLTRRMLGWIVIITLAFGAEQYKELANAAYQLPDAIASAVSDGDYSANAIDKSFEMTHTKFKDLYKKTDLISGTEFGYYLASVGSITLMFLMVLAFYTLMFAYYLVVKVSLAAILVVGPLFLGFFLFPSTRQWGMNWINQIANYSVTITLYVILGIIHINVADTILSTALDGALNLKEETGWFGEYVDGASLTAAILLGLPAVFFSTVIFILVAWSVPSIANALTGGAGVTGHTRELGAFAKGVDKSTRYIGGKIAGVGREIASLMGSSIKKG